MKRPSGKVLMLALVSLSAILGVVGLVFDAGLMMADTQNLQHATDAAAQAGAMEFRLGKGSSQATDTATTYLRNRNAMADANITVNIPPLQGAFAGRDGFLEVIATRQFNTRLMHMVGAAPQQTFAARSVAGVKPSTAGAAIVVLDPNPPPLSVAAIPLVLPSLPALVGGLEVLGIGNVSVDGAVLVNTSWGGVDENGRPAGDGPGPPFGVSCTPPLGVTRLHARDIRVAGGVDNPNNYGHYVSGNASPLRGNRLAVPDPFQAIPVPSMASDPANVVTQLKGGKQVATLPLLTTTLQPGVYDWIEIVSGNVVFQPGVYIIRDVNPISGIALNILGGTVTASGVLFYVTNSANYDAASGTPDNADGENRPASSIPGLIPSVVINSALAGRFSPLADVSSPFHGMLIFQRRSDARPILIVNQNLLPGGTLAGTLYAKWGHVLLVGAGTYDLRIAAGTARLVAIAGMRIVPTTLLPPAQDVYLVE